MGRCLMRRVCSGEANGRRKPAGPGPSQSPRTSRLTPAVRRSIDGMFGVKFADMGGTVVHFEGFGSAAQALHQVAITFKNCSNKRMLGRLVFITELQCRAIAILSFGPFLLCLEDISEIKPG